MAAPGLHELAGVRVPQPDRHIRSTGRDARTVRTVGGGGCRAAMPVQRENFLAARQKPDAHRSIHTAGNEAATVRTKGHFPHNARVPPQNVRLRSLARSPEFDYTARISRRKSPAVRG